MHLPTNHVIRQIFLIGSFFLLPFAAAQAAGSLAISTITPGTTVFAGTQVTFTITPTGFTNPAYSIDDNFGGTTLTSSRIDGSGNFSWTPTSNDIGTHSFTIAANDSLGDSASLPVTISVSQPTISLGSAQPSATISVGQGVSFFATASGFTNPSFVLNDAFGSGTTITNTNINASGNFSWTPATSDVGLHPITVTVSDAAGHSANATQNITVNAAPTLSIQSLSPGASVNPGQTVSFNATPVGMTNPSYTVTDSFALTTVSNTKINSAGQFSWTPTSNETGTHNLVVTATDGGTGRSVSVTQTITVLIPGLSIQGSTSGLATVGGNAVTFNVGTNGYVNPTYTVTDSFTGGTVLASNINTSGIFTWIPQTKDIGTHTLTVTVSDASGHTGTVAQTFVVQNPTTATPVATSTPLIISSPPATVSASPVIVTSSFTSYLSRGSSGDEVTALQTLLYQKGYLTTSPNGSFGPLTEAAVKRFQVAQGLSALGAVGPQTRDALNKLRVGGAVTANTSTASPSIFKFTRPLTLGAQGNEVVELQKRLTTLGLYTGATSGYFGTITRAAVKLFQTQHGLSPLGNVGPGTRAALNAE